MGTSSVPVEALVSTLSASPPPPPPPSPCLRLVVSNCSEVIVKSLKMYFDRILNYFNRFRRKSFISKYIFYLKEFQS